jgi:hypothetical protein
MKIVARILFLSLLAAAGLTAAARPAQAQTQTGFLEVCKEADPAAPAGVTGNFTFTVNGQAVSVPVGQCSLPIRVPAGTATVTETERTGFRLTGVVTDIPERLVSSDLDTRTAVVQVVAGDVSTQTIVRFRNRAVPTGFVEVCKEADPNSPSAVTGNFTFTVNGTSVSVPVGQCSQPIKLPAGTATVTEVARPGFQLTGIRTDREERLVSSDLDTRTAVVQVVAGDVSTQTIVRFRNRVAQAGQLKVCKLAGVGVANGASFTFNVNGQAVTVSAGSCSAPLNFPQGTEVSVTETNIPSNLQVAVITVRPESRLVEGSADLSKARVRIIIGSGVTEVTFTNQESQRGQLKVCKVGGPGVTGNFTFTVSGVGNVTVAAGSCSLPITLAVGTQVTVTETNIPANVKLVSVTSAPVGRVKADLKNNAGLVTVGTGVTEVTFRNELRQPACAPKTCTYTIGGYKNKPERFTGSTLTVGGESLNVEQLVSVLNMSPGQNGNPNFAIQVARQLIAALANVARIQAAGGCVPQDVQAAIAAAQSLLNGCLSADGDGVSFSCTKTPSSTVTSGGKTYTASQLVNTLTAFNESNNCP